MSVSSHKLELAVATGDNATQHVKNLFLANKDDEINSIFYSVIKPICWYSLNHTVFPGSSDRLVPPDGCDYVMYSYLSADLPALAIKPEYTDHYRIAWCRNVLHEMVLSADCKVNEFGLQSFDSHWLNIEPEFYLTPGFEYQYDKGVGNIPALQEYSNKLPRSKLRADQPWFYSQYPSSAFPLFMLNSQSQFKHSYRFNTDINDLLRMQRFHEGIWIDIHPDLSVITGLPNNNKLPDPTLHGCFGRIRDNEKEYGTCHSNQHVFYVENIIACDESNTATIGKSVTVDLKCEGMCKAIFWAGYNSSSAKYNIRSNYTTSWDNTTNGDSPIGPMTLSYGITKKFDKVDPDMFSGPMIKHHFPRAPRHEGFFAHAFSYNTRSFGIELTVDINNLRASLGTTLVDPESTRWKNGHSDIREAKITPACCDDEFIFIVRLLTMREMIIDASGNVSYNI